MGKEDKTINGGEEKDQNSDKNGSDAEKFQGDLTQLLNERRRAVVAHQSADDTGDGTRQLTRDNGALTIDKLEKDLDTLGVRTKENGQVVEGNTSGNQLALATLNDEVDIASECGLHTNPKVDVIIELQLNIEIGAVDVGVQNNAADSRIVVDASLFDSGQQLADNDVRELGSIAGRILQEQAHLTISKLIDLATVLVTQSVENASDVVDSV